MARLPRLSAAGQLHLAIQKGHNQQPIVLDDDDRRAYLGALREAAAGHDVTVLGYALLDTEVLLLLTPPDATSLGRMMQALGRRYVGGFNRRHGRAGTLWEGRFRNTVVESERYFLPCLRHVELAPLREGVATDPLEYTWSSVGHHLGRRRDPIVRDHPLYWALGNTPFEREQAYRRWLEDGETAAESAALRAAALKGWALGSDAFLKGLRAMTDRPTAPRRRGRPSRHLSPFR